MGLRYGLVVVDECHHVPAVTFERCVRQLPVRRWLGLTATPYRRDGLQGLITMYCGPIRHRIGARNDATSVARLELVVHGTKHSVPESEGLGIQDLFRGIVEDHERTEQICADVLMAVHEAGICLVLAQWTEHVEAIADGLRQVGLDPYVLYGGMPKKQRREVVEKLNQTFPGGGLLLVATGGLLGEGFDCPPLDTLFLAFPLRSRAGSSSTSGGSFGPCRKKQVSRYTITLISKYPCWLGCMESVCLATRALGSTPSAAQVDLPEGAALFGMTRTAHEYCSRTRFRY